MTQLHRNYLNLGDNKSGIFLFIRRIVYGFKSTRPKQCEWCKFRWHNDDSKTILIIQIGAKCINSWPLLYLLSGEGARSVDILFIWILSFRSIHAMSYNVTKLIASTYHQQRHQHCKVQALDYTLRTYDLYGHINVRLMEAILIANEIHFCHF